MVAPGTSSDMICGSDGSAEARSGGCRVARAAASKEHAEWLRDTVGIDEAKFRSLRRRVLRNCWING